MFELTVWHWFVLACVLLAIELTAPVSFFLWLAAAAFASTAVSFFFPNLAWQLQLALFALFNILGLLTWHLRGRVAMRDPDRPHLNQRNLQYLNKEVTVVEAIKDGLGKVRANDSLWTARGEDADIGERVIVERVEGSVFHVKK